MDLKQLRYFLAVRNHNSINRAAAELNVAQPAVSRQIRKLESELNALLLERSAAGVRLTKSGELLCELSDEIFERIDEIRDRVGGQSDLGARIALGLPPAISRLLMKGGVPILPELQRRFRLNISEGPSYRLIEWVQSGELALAIVTDPEDNVRVDRTPIWDEPLFLVGARDRQMPATVRLEDLQGEKLILTTREDPVRRYLDRAFEARGVRANIELEIESLPSLLTMIANNDMKSIMPLSAFMEEYDRGLLSAASVRGLHLRRVAVVRHRFHLPVRMRHLVGTFQREVRTAYIALARERNFDISAWPDAGPANAAAPSGDGR